MKTKFKQLFIVVSVLAVLVVLPAAVKADPIILTLDTVQSVTQGSSVTFMGRLENLGAPGRFINGTAITLNVAGLTTDDTAFFANVPAFLGPGTNSGPLEAFFDVIASLTAVPGTYTGSFSVLGGADDAAQDLLATQEFRITVLPAGGGGDPVPEPATMLLLGSGLAGAAALKRRKRGQTQTP